MAFYKSDSLAEDIAALFAGAASPSTTWPTAKPGHSLRSTLLGSVMTTDSTSSLLMRSSAADQSLRLSWGQTKDASYYQVFYRQAGQSAFTQC